MRQQRSSSSSGRPLCCAYRRVSQPAAAATPRGSVEQRRAQHGGQCQGCRAAHGSRPRDPQMLCRCGGHRHTASALLCGGCLQHDSGRPGKAYPAAAPGAPSMADQ